MNILVLSPYLLEENSLGGMIRFVKFVKFLKQRHSVFIVSLDERNQWRQAPELLEGIEMQIVERPVYSTIRKVINKIVRIKPSFVVNCYSKKMAETINEIIVSKSIDLVHVEFTYMGEYIHDIKKKSIATVLVDQELNFRRITRELQSKGSLLRLPGLLLEYVKQKKYETAICSHFNKIFAITEEEKAVLLDSNKALDIDIYPNVVDSEHFSPESTAAVSEDPVGMVFIGNYHHKPNEAGMLWFYDNVYPLIKQAVPDAGMNIVGANPTPRIKELAKNEEITVTGFVDDIRPYLKKSAVFINPIITGGGMRGKVIEAMASCRAVVSTSMGAEGIEASHGANMMIADTPGEFANAVVDIMHDEELKHLLARNAQALVKEKYDERVVFTRMEKKYTDLVKQVQ